MIPVMGLVALALVGFGLVSRRLENSVLTPPIVFVGLGTILAATGLVRVDLHAAETWLHLLAEMTLVIVLFTDASQIRIDDLRREHDLPVRMLLVGLPLTVGLGILTTYLLFPAWGWLGAGLAAAILAPTDAALGQAVLASPEVPSRIRQTLNVESGLNDGIALPVVLLFLCALAAGEDAESSASYWIRFTVLQVTLGPLVGLLVGWLGGRAVERAGANDDMSHSFQSMASVGLAVLSFALAEAVGGNGFLAAFIGGLTLGNTSSRLCHCLFEFGETEGQLFSLLTFVAFGALMVPEIGHHLSLTHVALAVLALTLYRMGPVALSLIGKGQTVSTTLFLGWFGPRGIASILFALLVVERLDSEMSRSIVAAVSLTVLLSVVLHGVTAAPLSRLYAARLAPEDANGDA